MGKVVLFSVVIFLYVTAVLARNAHDSHKRHAMKKHPMWPWNHGNSSPSPNNKRHHNVPGKTRNQEVSAGEPAKEEEEEDKNEESKCEEEEAPPSTESTQKPAEGENSPKKEDESSGIPKEPQEKRGHGFGHNQNTAKRHPSSHTKRKMAANHR